MILRTSQPRCSLVRWRFSRSPAVLSTPLFHQIRIHLRKLPGIQTTLGVSQNGNLAVMANLLQKKVQFRSNVFRRAFQRGCTACTVSRPLVQQYRISPGQLFSELPPLRHEGTKPHLNNKIDISIAIFFISKCCRRQLNRMCLHCIFSFRT